MECGLMPKPAQIYYREGYKYQLAEDYYVRVPIKGYSVAADFLYLDPSGMLVIKRGYAWDGATGAPDFKVVMRGSLVHDALYQLMRLGKIPKTYKTIADRVFKLICEEAGAYSITAEIYWRGVDIFGKLGLGKDRPVLEAP
jgi:hypothetical protein